MAQDSTLTNMNDTLSPDEERKLQQLNRNAVKARASITQELGLTAGAAVDSVRYILEEILSYRLDTMRKSLIERNKTDAYFKKEIQQRIAMMEKQSLIIKDDNHKLKQQIMHHSVQNAKENNSNSKLNTITLQNLKSLALLKRVHQAQLDSAEDRDGYEMNGEPGVNQLKKLKMENVELKAQLKQSENHIKYLEESKVNTIMTMSQEIQKLRQQIIDLSKTTNTPTRR
eukprot:90813_1